MGVYVGTVENTERDVWWRDEEEREGDSGEIDVGK